MEEWPLYTVGYLSYFQYFSPYCNKYTYNYRHIHGQDKTRHSTSMTE